MYRCTKCKKEVKAPDPKFTRCPHCGWRVLNKARQPIAKDVSTD